MVSLKILLLKKRVKYKKQLKITACFTELYIRWIDHPVPIESCCPQVFDWRYRETKEDDYVVDGG